MAGSPFRGRFSSCLVNYAGPASGRDRERQREGGIAEPRGCQKLSGPINGAPRSPFPSLLGLLEGRVGVPGGPLHRTPEAASAQLPVSRSRLRPAAAWAAGRAEGGTPVSAAQGRGDRGPDSSCSLPQRGREADARPVRSQVTSRLSAPVGCPGLADQTPVDSSIADHSVLPNRTSSRFPHFLLPSRSCPNPFRSPHRSSTLAPSSPNPNSWEFGEPWFHCPHLCPLLADSRPWKESCGREEGAWIAFPPGPQPEARCPSPTAEQPLPSTSAFADPIPCLQLWASSFPGWAGTWQGLLGGVWEGTTNKTDKRMSRERLPEMPGVLSGDCVPGSAPPCSLPETGSVRGGCPCLAL